MSESLSVRSIAARHEALLAEVHDLAGRVAVREERELAIRVAAFVGYFGAVVLPQLDVENDAIVERLRIGGIHLHLDSATMIAAHRRLSDQLVELSKSGVADAASMAAAAVEAAEVLFVAHEEVFRLFDTSSLWAEVIHLPRLTPLRASEPSDEYDLEAVLMDVLLASLERLCNVGDADSACALGLEAWSAVSLLRNDLSVELAERLQECARLAMSAPVSMVGRERTRKLSVVSEPELDVRSLTPERRYQLISSAFEVLSPGASFVLESDHDPQSVRALLEAEHAAAFSWIYLEEGPAIWHVRIGRNVISS